MSTDTLYSDTPAVDNGSKAVQFFIGKRSKYRSVFPLGKTNAKFPAALLEEIRKRGAMTRIISDGAKAQLSNKVKDTLRTLIINDGQSEPHQQQQNLAKR